MRIGIISDVHGDYEALTKTLNWLRQDHKVAYILCAGDLVGRGPNQDQVVDLIKSRGIPTVRGNHDEWFYGISKENGAYLKNLPIDWRARIGGVKVYMCHGKPGNNMWGMYRDHLSATYLNMVMSSLDTNVLITGHTHIPLYLRVEAGCVINPGSIYTFQSQRVTSSTYGVLNLSDLSFDLFDTRYDAVTPAPATYTD